MSDSRTFEVIVPVYRSRHVLQTFLDCLDSSVPVILVDNSARDEDLADLVAQYPEVRHMDSGGNLGFSAAANLGAAASKAEFLIFMNPDTQPTSGSLQALVAYLVDNPDVVSCGAAGIGTSGGGGLPTARRMLVHSLGLHRSFPQSGLFYMPSHGEVLDVEWVSGSCLAIRRSAFDAVGGFDPAFFIYMSDFDLGDRLSQKGLRQVLLGDVVVTHDDGGSSDLSPVVAWERRGRAWTRYLRRARSFPTAVGITALLVTGLAARTLLYAVSGQRRRAHEVWTYLRSAISEWISPRSGSSSMVR